MTKNELLKLFYEDVTELRSVFNDWLATRPQCVKNTAALYPPDQFYRLKEGPTCPAHADHNGAIGAIHSYFEDGDVRFLVMHLPSNPSASPCDHVINPDWLQPVKLEELRG